jgi:hypothetical protein
MSEYLEPEKNQETKRSEKQNNQPADQNTDPKNNDKASGKKKHFKVLNEDGSFADLPYNNEPGGGALEGTVGIGT